MAVAARWQTSEHQTCPNVVLPAGLSGFRTEVKQKEASEASVLPLQWYVEAPEGCLPRLIPRLKEKEMKIRSRLGSVLTDV